MTRLIDTTARINAFLASADVLNPMFLDLLDDVDSLAGELLLVFETKHDRHDRGIIRELERLLAKNARLRAVLEKFKKGEQWQLQARNNFSERCN